MDNKYNTLENNHCSYYYYIRSLYRYKIPASILSNEYQNQVIYNLNTIEYFTYMTTKKLHILENFQTPGCATLSSSKICYKSTSRKKNKGKRKRRGAWHDRIKKCHDLYPRVVRSPGDAPGFLRVALDTGRKFAIYPRFWQLISLVPLAHFASADTS